jgi:acyl-CoA thioester hydrolase
MEGFPVSTELVVRFSELDAQGIVHNSVYLTWFEIARIEYIARLPGGYAGMVEQGVDVTTVESHVRYRKPCRFDDALVLRVRVGELKGPRFRFDYAIERNGELVADGWTTHACVDAATLRPIRLPRWIADGILAIERSSPPEPSHPRPA